MDKSISQKVLEKIKEEKIAPKPEWRFSVYRITVLTLLGFFLVAGSISLGIIFDLFSQFEIQRLFGRPKGIKLIFLSLPYIWIILLAFFSFLAVMEFIKTRHGYKYKTSYVILFFSVLVLALGIFFHALGICNALENYMESYVPAYNQIIKTPQSVWFQPENGLLSGMIIMDDEMGCHCLELQDWNREIWKVEYSGAIIRPMVRKNNGEIIKIVGSKKAEHRFEAEEIRSWIGKKMQKVEEKY